MMNRNLVGVCVGLLLVQVAASYSYSSTIAGDVIIQTLQNGSLYCDSMICPPGTATCQVTKRNDPNDFQVIVRHRRCLNGNGAVLEEQQFNEQNTYQITVNTNIVSGSGFQGIQNGSGRQMTPEEQRQLDEYLRATQQQVQNQIDGSLNQLYTSLGPLLDGSFATNLNNQIRASVRDSLNFHR